MKAPVISWCPAEIVHARDANSVVDVDGFPLTCLIKWCHSAIWVIFKVDMLLRVVCKEMGKLNFTLRHTTESFGNAVVKGLGED